MSTAPRSEAELPASGTAAEPFLLRRAGRVAAGLVIIVGCYLAGEFVKARAGLIVPGSVLGLFLLLALLGTRLVRLAWVEEASRWFLFVMPLSFVPIYVNAGADHALWREWGVVIVGVLALTVAMLWIAVGRLTQWIFGAAARKGGS